MSSLAIIASSRGLSSTPVLLGKKETLTKRVEDLRVQLQQLQPNHESKKLSLQARQAKWDAASKDQKAKNEALRIKNNELSQTIALYQSVYTVHRCSPYPTRRRFFNVLRAQARVENAPMQRFLDLLNR